MSFKDMVESDIQNVFLNTAEFAETRTVIYDGETYEDIPIVLSNIKEKDRNASVQDHAQHIYRVTQTLHCDLADLGGVRPEQGMTIRIEDENGYYDKYTVAQVGVEMGMLRIELEAFDE